MIKSVTTRGIKTASSSVGLGRATLITGPVGAGKTAIADAIQFAALGCIPRVGRNEAATARLMRGTRMSCEIALDDGRWLARELSLDGSSLKGGASTSWAERKAKATEIGEEIRAMFGASVNAAEENLDIMRLLGRSGSELAKTIEAILDAGGLDETVRIARAIQLVDARLDSERKKVDGFLQPIPPSEVAVWDEVRPKLVEIVANSIVKAIDFANGELLKARAATKEKRAAYGQLEDRRNATDRPAASAESLRATLAESQRRRTELTTQIDMHTRASRDRADAEAAIEAAINRARAAGTADADAQAALPRVDELRAQIEAIVELDEVPAPEIRTADNLPEDPPQPTARLVPGPIDTRKEWLDAHTARVAAEKAEGNPWREVESIASELDGADFRGSEDLIPTIEGMVADLRRLASEHGGNLDALKAAAEVAAETYRKAEGQAAERKAEIEAIEAENKIARAAWETECAATKADRERILAENKAHNDAARKAHAEATAQRRAALADIESNRRRMTSEIESIRSKAAEAARAKVEADRALESAQARLSGLTDALPIDVASAQAEVLALVSTIDSTEVALKAVVAAEAINAEMSAMIREIERSTAAAEVFSSIEWALKRLRDEDMESRTGPLIERMQRLLRAAGRNEEPFLRCEKGAAAFGWRTADGEDVDVAALSGGQAVLFRAAIAYAIVCTRAPEIRVLLVELAEASDGTTEQDVLRALLEVSDEIQVIVASCVPVEAPDGWTVIDVAARVQEATA